MERLVLVQQKEVPADASILVIAGPRTDFLPGELDALKSYLARGGKILCMIDPPQPCEPDTVTGLTGLLAVWGITAGIEIVLDASGSELMRSPTRSFIVQQTSVQNPNSAIARPRPRPAGN